MTLDLKNLILAGRVLRSIEEPIDPDDFPGTGGGGGTGTGGTPLPTALPGLGQFLVPRYTSNLVINEEIPLLDLLYDVLNPSSRHFLSQNWNGKIKLGSKKETDWCLTTAAAAAGATSLSVDNVAPWIDDPTRYLLIDPYTTESEVRQVTDANYSTSQNSTTLTQSAFESDGTTPATNLFTITGFAGCDGNSTPATATLECGTPVDGYIYSVTLDGTVMAFTTSAADTAETVSSFIASTIKGHPELRRRFTADFDGVDTVTLTARFGTLTLDTALELAHTAGVADPTTAPTLAASAASTSLLAGVYRVTYAYRNARGQTILSPYKQQTIVDGDKITVSAVTPPAGCTVAWYVSCAPGSNKMRFHLENDGSGFDITTLPKLSAPLPPDLNRTGAECMRIMATFSDRSAERAKREASNVIRTSFEWFLGTRDKAVNRIDLKFRDSADDWRLVELRLRDDAHIAKTKKTSNHEINGQAIDNYFQAYRIAAGELAERRDCDFFYKWAATRDALLLEEGDVVAITDDGSGVVNLPVRIEAIDMDVSSAGLPKASFTGRKFYNEMFDDSPNDVTKAIVVED